MYLESEQVDGYDIFTGVSVVDNIDGIIDNSNIATSGTLERIPGTYKVQILLLCLVLFH